MINEIRLRNVRVFSGKTWKFPLRDLTVFCGTNSAGKSTLLKIVPLLRQTQGVRDSLKSTEARLKFVGSQVDFGNFECFASSDRNESDVEIGLTVSAVSDPDFLSFFSADAVDKPSVEADAKSGMVSYDVSADFRFDVADSHSPTDSRPLSLISGPALSPARGDTASLCEARYSVSKDHRELLAWRVFRRPQENVAKDSGPWHAQHLISIPSEYFEKIGAARLMTPDSKEGHDVSLPVTLRGLLPYSIVAKRSPRKDSKEEGTSNEQKTGWFPIPPHIDEANQDLARAIVSTRYVGPLRAPARRFYLTRFDDGNEADPTGEYLPYIMRDLQDLSPVFNVRDPSGGDLQKESLSDALNYWLYFLRTGVKASSGVSSVEIESSQTKSVLVEIRLLGPQSAQTHSIADSGFGYSQVLPILVSTLLSDPGDTVLVEQPELHLNPALQVRLAEFFVAMIRSGRQVVLETHSEHIVNSVRVLVAEDVSGELASKCSLYYIDANSGRPVVQSLDIQPNGNVPQWPASFFGEAGSLAGRLLRAQKRFRRDTTEAR
jgi:predicted ATPase